MIALDNDKAEDLRVGHNGKHNENDGDRVTWLTERVLLEREVHGDEPLQGHAEDEPAGHQVTHVFGKVVYLTGGVAVRTEDALTSGVLK